ncbi:hypothetical protein EHP00_2292 [Ecytonucleospora hepatopenaei]|uniref:Uncharacterized protein n=1 Tax=Ecytonucleospora hepatopenaei TaxID=646526 RepID=A0A1W0E3L2_9MICR|nr:hypothetical protein EHP00_2292 [Ecytonucleospora hepatopenaei]
MKQIKGINKNSKNKFNISDINKFINLFYSMLYRAYNVNKIKPNNF